MMVATVIMVVVMVATISQLVKV